MLHLHIPHGIWFRPTGFGNGSGFPMLLYSEHNCILKLPVCGQAVSVSEIYWLKAKKSL